MFGFVVLHTTTAMYGHYTGQPVSAVTPS